MQAVRRFAGGDPGMITDAGIAIAGAGLIAVAAWDPVGLTGTTIAGPPWLLVLLPLLIGAALALRRRAPLLMWIAIWAGIALQDLITRHPPQSLYVIFVLFAGSYSLGAHASLRRAAAGLAITAPAMVLISRLGGASLGLSVIPLLAFWLAGVLVRARRQAASLAARNAVLQRQAEQATAAERTRIARELHDIVAHHLSVVDGHRIAGVVAAGDVPAEGPAFVDLPGQTVLPGMIDCHTHLVGEPDSGHGYAELLARTGAQEALSGARNARDTLLAGFTTVRDVGTFRAFVDVALRDAIDEGWVAGPRMRVAGAYVTCSGGGTATRCRTYACWRTLSSS